MAVRPFNVRNLGNAVLFDPNEMGYRDSVDVIKEESVKIQKSFVKIGWYLKHIQDNELYREDGYANISECAAEQFGYSQSTVSRFIGICEKFSKNHNSPELDEKYAGFDKSQMIEMLPMSLEQLEEVKPDMTVRQIRDIKENGKPKEKKIGKTNESEDVEEKDVPGQTSIEEDFPEYMPDGQNISDSSGTQEENYATSHKDQVERNPDEENITAEDSVIDGTYKETRTFSQEVTQPEFPILKNNEQRKEWLKKYKDWGLWYRDDNIDVNYYKFDFKDGSRLVVVEYPNRHSYWGNGWKDEFFYHLLEKDKKAYEGKNYDESFRHQPDCETYLVEFLKKIQK